MAAIKYKDPSTNLWEEVGEIIKGKDAAYVGSSAPIDPQYTIWVDTSETGEGLVTSINGQVGAVTVKEAASATVFQLGAGASTVTSFSTGIYDPNNSTVRIYLVARSTSDMGFSTVLATVPEAYRPTQQVTLYGAMKVNDLPFAYIGHLTPGGNIVQDLSSTARDVFLCGEYVI